VYQGPIGAILTPQLQNLQHSKSLPYASSLCGACYDVCPVKINIPEILVLLRGKIVRQQQDTLAGTLDAENMAMQLMARLFRSAGSLVAAESLARFVQWPFVSNGTITHLPGMLSGWTATRDLMAIPEESFRSWWRKRQAGEKR
jgi:L-lactate dehydrogenase complex protein LldF